MESLIVVCLFLFSCGDYSSGKQAPESDAYKEIKPLIEKHCGRCHDFNESSFKHSKTEQYIKDGTMPKDHKLPAEDKQKLLAYFTNSNAQEK